MRQELLVTLCQMPFKPLAAIWVQRRKFALCPRVKPWEMPMAVQPSAQVAILALAERPLVAAAQHPREVVWVTRRSVPRARELPAAILARLAAKERALEIRLRLVRPAPAAEARQRTLLVATLTVAELTCIYRMHTGARGADAQRHLDRIAGTLLPGMLAQQLDFTESGPVVVIDRLRLRQHITGLARLSDEAITLRWARGLSVGISRRIAGAATDMEGIAVFEDQVDWIAACATDHAVGGAKDDWRYAPLATYLESASPALALRRLLSAEPSLLPAVLARLARQSRLDAVLTVLGEAEAAALLALLAAADERPEVQKAALRPIAVVALELLGEPTDRTATAAALDRLLVAGLPRPVWDDGVGLARLILAAIETLRQAEPGRTPVDAATRANVLAQRTWLDRATLERGLMALETGADNNTLSPGIEAFLSNLVAFLHGASETSPVRLALATLGRLAELHPGYAATAEAAALAAEAARVTVAWRQGTAPAEHASGETRPGIPGQHSALRVRVLALLADASRASSAPSSPPSHLLATHSPELDPADPAHSRPGASYAVLRREPLRQLSAGRPAPVMVAPCWSTTACAGLALTLRAFTDAGLERMLATACRETSDRFPKSPGPWAAAVMLRWSSVSMPEPDAPLDSLLALLAGLEPGATVGTVRTQLATADAAGLAAFRAQLDGRAEILGVPCPEATDADHTALAAGALGFEPVDEVVERAAILLLRLWARWLRGFAASSLPYLLARTVHREGIWLADAETIRVAMASRPLDPVLRLAGYLDPLPAGAGWLAPRRLCLEVLPS